MTFIVGDQMFYSYYTWLKLKTDTTKCFTMSPMGRYNSRHNMNYSIGNIKRLFFVGNVTLSV